MKQYIDLKRFFSHFNHYFYKIKKIINQHVKISFYKVCIIFIWAALLFQLFSFIFWIFLTYCMTFEAPEISKH